MNTHLITATLVPIIIWCVAAWAANTYLPKPVGLVIAILIGLIIIVTYILPLL